ncbi:MAG: hypothetical protein LBE91_19695 [Tannerella sp.]|jgi:hypothetical protein|nr:hypothetical protein [Tannerella sp.]
MIRHDYFGKVEKGWSGFSSEYKVKIPHFETEVEVCLGEEFDEDGEEIETPPTNQQLTEFERTLKDFLNSIDSIIEDIQQSSFERYQRIYAKYYEKPFEILFENAKVQKPENSELHSPLNIDTKEKHFEYMKEIIEKIRILDNQTIKIPIRYALDEEHGLELKIVNNKVVAVGGIAET